jgi:glycosyltransferase involved in cell wall biosynthesis
MPPLPVPTPISAPNGKPVAAHFLTTFLKPEMLHIYRQITALKEFQSAVLCQKREHADAFPFSEIRILPKPRTRALRRFWQKQILGRPITIYRSEARRIEAILRDIAASVLHVYFGHIGVHVLPLLEMTRVPSVVSFHGADLGIDVGKPAYRAMARQMFDQATLLLVRSESLFGKLVSLGASPDKIRLHRTGIPLGEISFEQRVPPADGGWRCVQACRLIPKKGLATTLRAFATFARAYPHATLTVAGEGPQLDELHALAANLQIAPSVRFIGFVGQAELRALYARSHFFLHPSETPRDGDQEGVPNSMLEAMASGLPILATNHGGIPEAVEHGISGWLVAERDHEALAQGMLALTHAHDLYTRLSAAAAASVTRQFDLEKQTRIMEGFYGEAMLLAAKKLAE